MSLPSPIKRRGQKMYKAELWDVLKRQKENMDAIGDWVAKVSKESLAEVEGVGSESRDKRIYRKQNLMTLHL